MTFQTGVYRLTRSESSYLYLVLGSVKIGTMLFDIHHNRQAQHRCYLRHNLPHREVRQKLQNQAPFLPLTDLSSTGNSKSPGYADE